MVHFNNLKKFSIKKLISLSVVFALLSSILIAQENSSSQNYENQNEISSASSLSFDENSTDYFNTDSANVENQNTNRRGQSTVWMFVRMILVLVLICGLIYLFVWLLKKKSNIPSTENEYLRRAAYISIGQNKTVEVITLIDKAYLIGTTEDNITLLGEIDDKELIQAMNLSSDKKQNVKNPVNFSEVLEMFTRKTKKNAGSVFESSEENIDKMISNIESSNNSEHENNEVENQKEKGE